MFVISVVVCFVYSRQGCLVNSLETFILFPSSQRSSMSLIKWSEKSPGADLSQTSGNSIESMRKWGHAVGEGKLNPLWASEGATVYTPTRRSFTLKGSLRSAACCNRAHVKHENMLYRYIMLYFFRCAMGFNEGKTQFSTQFRAGRLRLTVIHPHVALLMQVSPN